MFADDIQFLDFNNMNTSHFIIKSDVNSENESKTGHDTQRCCQSELVCTALPPSGHSPSLLQYSFPDIRICVSNSGFFGLHNKLKYFNAQTLK